MENYKMLGEAIVVQACEDYKDAYERYIKAIDDMKECESFFNGEWYTELTTLDPQKLMSDLKKEVNERCIEESCKNRKDEHKRVTKRRLKEETVKARKAALKSVTEINKIEELINKL